MRAETLLGKLETSFVLRDFMQLEAAFLVRSKAGDFPDHFTHEFDLLVLDALSARRLNWRDGETA